MTHVALSVSGLRIIALAFAASSLTFFFGGDALRLVLFSDAGISMVLSDGQNATTSTASHRKLLQHAMVEPNRVRGDKCTKTGIAVSQSPTSPLPSGIPTYTVEITNVCVSGCEVSGIHLSCGWFSSATLINPKIFKRLSYNDCLVNDGKPLKNGETLSFKYATIFSYPLAVSSAFCA